MDRAELLAAMEARHAVRRYLDRPIPADLRAEIDQAVERCNRESGLAIKVFYDEPEGFRGGLTNYGSLYGVNNYFALIGQTGTPIDRSCGYYGEQLVLLAQHLGLNTCWTALSYNKRKIRAHVGPDDKLALAIALGYGEQPGKPHKSKPIEQLGAVSDGRPMPDWFRDGLVAASLAPTALNHQKFFFTLDGERVHAKPGLGTYTLVDLGIAKYHFEVGAGDAAYHWAD